MDEQKKRVRLIAQDGEFLEDWLQEEKEQKRELWKKRGIYAFIAAGIIGISTLYRGCIQEEAREYLPKAGYPTVDLDHNGVSDWIVLRGDGYKMPLYGVQYDG